MKIMAGHDTLFAERWADEYADMGLVWCLVGRETGIAVDAVSAVGRSKPRGLGVDAG